MAGNDSRAPAPGNRARDQKRNCTPRRTWSLSGSVLFGVGWGVAGFCPGPALVALGMGEVKAIVFVGAMLAGMGLFELLQRRH